MLIDYFYIDNVNKNTEKYIINNSRNYYFLNKNKKLEQITTRTMYGFITIPLIEIDNDFLENKILELFSIYSNKYKKLNKQDLYKINCFDLLVCGEKPNINNNNIKIATTNKITNNTAYLCNSNSIIIPTNKNKKGLLISINIYNFGCIRI